MESPITLKQKQNYEKILIFVVLLLLVLTCASAQSIENQLIASINKSKKVILHNKCRTELCDGITRTTIDRDGKAWMFDLYSSKKASQFERVIVVKSDQWYVSRESLMLQKNGTYSTDNAPRIRVVKKFNIDQLTDVLLKYLKQEDRSGIEKVLAVR